MDIGTVIKKYRLEKNLTQEELAGALFVTPQAVSRWELGLSLPDVVTIPKIVHCLGVSADILLGCRPCGHNASKEADGEDKLGQDQINSIFSFPRERAERKNTRTVLSADDSSIMLMLLEDALSRGGYRVLTAEGGRECLELLEKEKADICTLDIGMPEMNGLEVLERIKEKYPETRVVMLSAQSAEENVRKALELGADHFIAKPFSANTLLQILDSLE
ncbi:MAG: response regulator [Bacteroides sp.]|nr:response regulator [Bacteroides sp.]